MTRRTTRQSNRKASPNRTRIQHAEATHAQLPQEPAQPEGIDAKIQAPTPPKHMTGGKPSWHPKKAAMTDPKAGPNGGSSRITRSSSRISQMGPKESLKERTPRERTRQRNPARRAGQSRRKPLSSNDVPSLLAEPTSEGVRLGITGPLSHRNVPSPTKSSTTPRRNRNNIASASIEVPHATAPLPATQKSPDLGIHLTKQTWNHRSLQKSPSITKPASTSTPPASVPLPFVFKDRFNPPPSPIPEGHKLVHLVRHCRAWHKYISNSNANTKLICVALYLVEMNSSTRFTILVLPLGVTKKHIYSLNDILIFRPLKLFSPPNYVVAYKWHWK